MQQSKKSNWPREKADVSGIDNSDEKNEMSAKSYCGNLCFFVFCNTIGARCFFRCCITGWNCFWFLLFEFTSFNVITARDVFMNVEIRKENQHDHHVTIQHQLTPRERRTAMRRWSKRVDRLPKWIITATEKTAERVSKDQDELNLNLWSVRFPTRSNKDASTYQLEHSDVLFPPEFITERWNDRQSVVRVHEDMNSGIQHWTKPCLTTLDEHSEWHWREKSTRVVLTGIQVMTIHQMINIVEWWKTWRNVIWVKRFRMTMKIVSMNSIALEKK